MSKAATPSITLTPEQAAAFAALLSIVPDGHELAQVVTEPEKVACSATVFEVVDGEVAERGCRRNAREDGFCTDKHATQDVEVARAKAVKSAEFVGWLRESAPARAERKAANKAKTPVVKANAVVTDGENPNKVLAAALRAQGVPPTGPAWVNAKSLVSEGFTPEQAAKTVAATLR